MSFRKISDNGLPFPQNEDSLKKAEFKNLEPFIQFLRGATVDYGKCPNFTEKSDRSKSKPPKAVRKRDQLLALMREKRPDKIMKIIQVSLFIILPK